MCSATAARPASDADESTKPKCQDALVVIDDEVRGLALALSDSSLCFPFGGVFLPVHVDVVCCRCGVVARQPKRGREAEGRAQRRAKIDFLVGAWKVSVMVSELEDKDDLPS